MNQKMPDLEKYEKCNAVLTDILTVFAEFVTENMTESTASDSCIKDDFNYFQKTAGNIKVFLQNKDETNSYILFCDIQHEKFAEFRISYILFCDIEHGKFAEFTIKNNNLKLDFKYRTNTTELIDRLKSHFS